jgi:hypothetical protein
VLPLLLAACAPLEPLDLDPAPGDDVGLSITRVTTEQCGDPLLLEGRAPFLAGTTATATVVTGEQPHTFAIDVDADGAFAIPKASLTVPVERWCPLDAPCVLPLTLSLQGFAGGEVVQDTASVDATLADDRVERFPDDDADGYGALHTEPACPDTPGFLDTSGDCDDTTAAAHPGHPRIHCDGLDNDCIDGEEHVKTLKVIAEGASPTEQLHWALANVDDGGQVLLCDRAPFVGSFEVDHRTRAMGPLRGKATLVADGGPAITVVGGYLYLADVLLDAVGGRPDGCLHIQDDSYVEFYDSSVRACTGTQAGAIDVDRTSRLLWRRGACTEGGSDGDGGCLNVRGAALLGAVDLIDSHADGRGGAAVVDGYLEWETGTCSGNTARDGGCIAVGPAGYVALGLPGGDPVLLAPDNAATGRGNQLFVQGVLETPSATIEPTSGPADDDVAFDLLGLR